MLIGLPQAWISRYESWSSMGVPLSSGFSSLSVSGRFPRLLSFFSCHCDTSDVFRRSLRTKFTHGTNRRPLSHLLKMSDGVKGLKLRFVKVTKRSWRRQEITGAFSTAPTPSILKDSFTVRATTR